MIVIVMGVAGAGKTTIGRALAEKLGWEFADADDYHSEANIGKICRGVPLDDENRRPWLLQLRSLIQNWHSEDRNGVLACSALKRSYRNELNIAPDIQFVYLKGRAELIARRLRSRKGHFANDAILASQFADLEESEDAVTINIDQPVEQIVAEIRERLRLA
jgi:gluconokinase